jgi:hypothetical protein
MLLLLRGPAEGFTADALSAQGSAQVARAARQGALKAASSRGDVTALQQLLGLGGGGAAETEGEQGVWLLRWLAAAFEHAVVLTVAIVRRSVTRSAGTRRPARQTQAMYV